MKKLFFLALALLALTGCADLKLMAGAAYSSAIAPLPAGTVTTRYAIMHPRNIDLEKQVEYLLWNEGGEATYGAMQYDAETSTEEKVALWNKWVHLDPALRTALTKELAETGILRDKEVL